MKKIKLLIMDVDGTLTDGKIYMGSSGEVFKAFDIKDGYGIHELLPEFGIKSVILTGRTSDIVLNRAKELEVDYVLQGVKNKVEALYELSKKTDCEFEEMAYIGDDEIDFLPMKLCAVSGCPINAIDKIKNISSYVSSKNGGDGAVREFIEWIIDTKMC